MAYSVNWVLRVVSIPTTDLVVVSGNHYQLPMYACLIEIRRLESAFTEGLWAAQILEHTNPKLDFAGANYAGFDKFLNGYTVAFTGSVERVDLVGSNNDLIDALVVNGVSVVPSNSAGLQIVETGAGGDGLTEIQDANLTRILELEEADEEHTTTSIIKRKKGTIENLLVKDVVGSTLSQPLTILEP